MEKAKFVAKVIIEAYAEDTIASVALLQETVAKFLRLKARDTITFNEASIKISPDDLEILPLSIEYCAAKEANKAVIFAPLTPCPFCGGELRICGEDDIPTYGVWFEHAPDSPYAESCVMNAYGGSGNSMWARKENLVKALNIRAVVDEPVQGDGLDFLNKTAWEKQARDSMRRENERYSEVVRLKAALQLVHDYQFMELEDFRANHPELMGLETNGAIHIAVWHKVRELLKTTGEYK